MRTKISELDRLGWEIRCKEGYILLKTHNYSFYIKPFEKDGLRQAVKDGDKLIEVIGTYSESISIVVNTIESIDCYDSEMAKMIHAAWLLDDDD